MRLENHHALWNKIQDFSINDGNAVTTFSGKLATSQKWSVSFTLRAIEEYKKFIFLCCISPTGAAPSHTVDEVWHLHLTYTYSYWTSFCKHTLEKEIHHYPSTGGKEEDDKHRDWYKDTLALYEDVFGTSPPEDIWPRPKQTIAGFELKWKKTIMLIILLFPFLFILLCFRTLIPFLLNGSQFLLFFPLYAFAIIRAYIIYHKHNKEPVEKLTEDRFPEDVSPFQMASFLHDKHRAVQTALIDLLKRDLVAVGNNQHFIVKNKYHTVMPGETNPLLPMLLKEENGIRISYNNVVKNWYNSSTFSHPALDGIYEFAHKPQPFFIRYIFQIALFSMALVRMGQGLINDRPIGFLVFETIICWLALYMVARKYSIRTIIQAKAQSLYKERVQNIDNKNAQIAPLYALEGTSAIKGFADAALLISIFGVSASTSNAWVGGSDSSCSGGSSCGGGSCGGGCGGCGGGD
jgi:hypothetical protein